MAGNVDAHGIYAARRSRLTMAATIPDAEPCPTAGLPMPSPPRIFDRQGRWQDRMALIVETMREMSHQTDPQAMVRVFGKRSRQLLPIERSVSLSRRGLSAPQYCITRSSTWTDEVNPWREKDRLPILEGGLLGKLIYSYEPQIIDDFEIAADDPGAEYFAGQHALMAI